MSRVTHSEPGLPMNKLFRITEIDIQIREHRCVLIDSGDMYANSIRKITSVLKERVCLLEVVIPHDF